MKLETGNIYSFHYRRYKNDPNPLALILYQDNNICHALNFHYLSKNLNEELILMIAKMATKMIKTESMYNLYHNWMKRNIPGVIEKAYRTYKPQHITSVKRMTRGYWGIQSFINFMKEREAHLDLTTVQKRLAEKIKKFKETERKKPEKKKVNLNKLQNYIIKYVEQADELVKEHREKDKSAYTKRHQDVKK
jgi:hypothetical protein